MYPNTKYNDSINRDWLLPTRMSASRALIDSNLGTTSSEKDECDRNLSSIAGDGRCSEEALRAELRYSRSGEVITAAIALPEPDEKQSASSL